MKCCPSWPQELLSLRAAGVSGTDEAIAKVGAELDELDPAQRSAVENQRQLNELLRATPAGQLALVRADMQLLAKALEEGQISAEQFTLAVQTRLGTLPDDIKRSSDAARELGLTFSSAFEDAIVGGKSFRDLLKGLEEDILRIVTRKLVTKPLADAVSGFVKGFGLPGFKPGGFTGNVGTSVPAGMVHGQEFVFSAPAVRNLGVGFLESMHQRARVAPQAVLPGYASGGYVGSTSSMRISNDNRSAVSRAVSQTVNQTFMISGPVDRRTSLQIAEGGGASCAASRWRGTVDRLT